MFYSSTRGGDRDLTFRDTVLTGLARDGGLILPVSFPDVRADLPRLSTLRYQDLAFEVMRLFADDIPADALRSIIEKSYSTFRHADVTPLVQVGDINVLELFHGPTFAFKDLALQFLGNLFEYVLGEKGEELNVVVATSGDTGSAAIRGLVGRRGIRVFVLHPAGRVSPVQELQMTSVIDDSVFNIALGGTFDDAQRIVKALFSDLPFKDSHRLGAVNSINWARILAQVVYYFYGAFRTMERTGAREVSFSVPTGNFGDVFAGYVAAEMGLPVRHLYVATNENDILHRFFAGGSYTRGEVVPTLSPSMDIQIASNFERWLYLHAGRDSAAVRAWMESFAATGSLSVPPLADGTLDPVLRSGRAGSEATLETIRRFNADYGRVLDPHTAVGVSVAAAAIEAGAEDPAVPVICLCTAHPAKFPDAIKKATGDASLAVSPRIEALRGLPTRSFALPAETGAVADFVVSRTR